MAERGPDRRFFGAVGGALMIGAFLAAIDVHRFVSSAQAAPGRVVALNAGGSHPQIRFTTARGEIVEYPQGGLIFGYAIGREVSVLYDPLQPERSPSLDSWGALWFGPLVLAILGLAFSGVGAWAVFQRRALTQARGA